jgi:hypothetical protein
MAVVALTSAKGAPGVTTTALALTLAWPRPALLVEADVSGSSSVLAGYFRGTRKHDRGLIDLAAAHRDGRIEDGVWDSAVPLDEQQKWLLPGLTTSTQSGTMRNLWDPLATVLRSLDTSGIDVIVDAGRSDVHNAPMPLLREADVSLLVSRTDLPSIAAARSRARILEDELAARGTIEDAVWLLAVGEGRPLGRRELKATVRLPVVDAAMAWDPAAAAVLSAGEQPEKPKKWNNSGFVRSARSAAVRAPGPSPAETCKDGA